MPIKTLAVVPHGRTIVVKMVHSLKENIWLSYMDKLHEEMRGPNFVPIRSRYCTAQSQKIIGRYYLDGFCVLNDSGRDCYEFHGCSYHGCPTCFPDCSRAIRRKHRENGFHMKTIWLMMLIGVRFLERLK